MPDNDTTPIPRPCLHAFIAGEKPYTARCTHCGFVVPVLRELAPKEEAQP